MTNIKKDGYQVQNFNKPVIIISHYLLAPPSTNLEKCHESTVKRSVHSPGRKFNRKRSDVNSNNKKKKDS